MCDAVLGIMTEVLAQPTPVQVSEATPSNEAPPASVSVNTPSDNNAPPPNSLAVETTPKTGADWGVDFNAIETPTQMDEAIRNFTGQQPTDLPEDAGTTTPPPAAEPSAPAAATPAQAPEPAAPAAPAEPALAKPGELPRNLNLPLRSQLDFETSVIIKDDRLKGGNLPFGEAEAQAKKKLGIADTAPAVAVPATAAAPAAPTTEEPAANTPTALDQAYADYETARGNFDSAGEVAALKRINSLERELGVAAQRQAAEQATAESAAQAEFDTAWNQSVQQAQQMFPALADANSPLSLRAAELQQQYGASTDPAIQAIYYSPTSALFFAQQAAATLAIAPTAAAPAPAAPQQQQAQPVVAPKSTPQSAPVTRPPMAPLLSGANHSGAPPAAPGFNVDSIQTSYQMDAIIASLDPNATD